MNIIPEPKLSDLTSIGLGGKAVALVEVSDAVDALALPNCLQRLGGRPFVLGRGSNLLADDGILPVVLIRMAQKTATVHRVGIDELGRCLVHVDAGLPLPRLLAWCARHSLTGLEGLAGIPGAVGGAVRMNAGSYGDSFGDILQTITFFTPTLGVRSLSREELHLEYRQLNLPITDEYFLLLSATLALKETPKTYILKKMHDCLQQKHATQPIHDKSAGCAFKNPPQYTAGRLLEAAGFRGKRLNGMCFSKKHANFLVNEGQGTGCAALELLTLAQETVARQNGIHLDLEVRRLTC